MHAERRTALTLIAGASLTLAGCTAAPRHAGFALTPEAFTAWLDGYKRAWEARDAAAAGALFTEDASYHEMPFDEAMHGRSAIEAYWTRVTAGQRDVQFSADIIACVGDQGVSHWHASFINAEDGGTIELDGVFVCRFADAGHVTALREWWHVKVTPPAQN